MIYFDLNLFYFLFVFIGFLFLVIRNPFILLIVFLFLLFIFSYLLFVINFYLFVLLINQIYLGALIVLLLFMIFLVSNYEYMQYGLKIAFKPRWVNINSAFWETFLYFSELIILIVLVGVSKCLLIVNGFLFLLPGINILSFNIIFLFSSFYDIFLNNFFIFDGLWWLQVYYNNILNMVLIVIILFFVLIGVVINLF